MKKTVVMILIVLFTNNLLYEKNAKIEDKSIFRTHREYQKALVFKKHLKSETMTANMFLISILVGTLFVTYLKE